MSDGVLVVSMAPPTNISTWAIDYQQSLRAGGDPFITKSTAPGFNGVSGITVINPGLGTLSVALFAAEMSGRQDDSYYYAIRRTDSGFASVLVEGYRLCSP